MTGSISLSAAYKKSDGSLRLLHDYGKTIEAEATGEDRARLRIKFKHRKVVQWLRAHIDIRLDTGLYFIEVAAVDGDVDLTTGATDLTEAPMITVSIFPSHVHIIKWLHEEKGVTDAGFGYVEAAKNGQLDVLKYLYEKKLDATVTHLAPKIGTELSGIQLHELTNAQRETGLLIAHRGVVFFRDRRSTLNSSGTGRITASPRTPELGPPKGSPRGSGSGELGGDERGFLKRQMYDPFNAWHSDVSNERQPPSYTSFKVLTTLRSVVTLCGPLPTKRTTASLPR
ncbi:TauD/TfdA-like domain [Phytophthora cactorum]|nr:TauD/TfdA-like domain [Phytophthora cactorum]